MADTFTPEQAERLLAYAGQRLGTTPEQLKEVFQQRGLAGLSELAGENTAKTQALLQDKTKLEALLRDPAVQTLLTQLLG